MWVCAHPLPMGGSHGGFHGSRFWLVVLYWGTMGKSKRGLCSEQRKWAFSLESSELSEKKYRRCGWAGERTTKRGTVL